MAGSYEIQGLPPKDCEALRAWRTVKPETGIDAKMRPILEEILLRDFPKGATIPPHIATWLSTCRRSFDGVDPRFLHCFYHLGVPDLVYAREVVAAHRMARLGDIVPSRKNHPDREKLGGSGNPTEGLQRPDHRGIKPGSCRGPRHPRGD